VVAPEQHEARLAVLSRSTANQALHDEIVQHRQLGGVTEIFWLCREDVFRIVGGIFPATETREWLLGRRLPRVTTLPNNKQVPQQ
jgi:hypothetical protein